MNQSLENGAAVVRKGAPTLKPELSVVVACHAFVCAIPTRRVQRLALNDDVHEAPGTTGVVLSGDEALAVFNLGTLLRGAPLDAAWVLLRVNHEGSELPIALRTGSCLFVRSIGVEAPLPGGLFAIRSGGVLGAFVAGSQIGLDETTPYGLVLSVDRLFAVDELHSAKSALARFHRRSRHE